MLLFFRFCICIAVAFFSLLSSSVFAAGFVNYTPASRIALTGSSVDARFDVAAALYNSGSPVPAPFIDTTNKTFSGAFYLSGAGWASFSTGVYSTRLDCGTQYLSGLTTPCTLSGFAWSENIGYLVFDRRVQYLPSTGTLSGKISTFMGDVSLSGVALPILPARFAGSTYTGIVDSHTTINLQNPSVYESSGGVWTTIFTPSGTAISRTYNGRSFTADLSLASLYNLSITDPNGSITLYVYATENGAPAMSLAADTATTFIRSFCSTLPTDSRCPDGSSLTYTKIDHSVAGVVGQTSTVADGQSYIDVHMKFRDKYGNPLQSGTLDILYNTPISTIQVPITDTTFFGVGMAGDAVVLSGTTLINYFDGTSGRASISLMGQDVKYGFASYAPGRIQLTYLRYNGADAGIITPELIFNPWYTIDAVSSSEMRIGTGATFTGVVTNHSSRTDISPTVIHGFFIGDGTYATFSDFVSSPMPLCQANQKDMFSYQNECNWLSMNGKGFPAIYAKVLNAAGDIYTFTGIYSPIIDLPFIPPEPVTLENYIAYQADTYSVLYPGTGSSLGTSSFQNRRIRILGQANIDGWYDGIATGRQSKADFFNAIRKNITLLSRNRANYSTANYLYTGSQIHLTNTDFSTKRTIIAEGQDVYIDGNIQLQGKSLAIIALKNPKTGSGGIIHIAPSVTDIHATLVAEQNIESTGSYQLYVHGSLISNNTLGGSSKSPNQCPYFISSCTAATAKLYDFEHFRSQYLSLPSKVGYTAVSPTAQRYDDTSFIVEYDARVSLDPPPGLEKK